MNKCVICGEPTKNKTCGPECLAELRSLNGTKMHKIGKTKPFGGHKDDEHPKTN